MDREIPKEVRDKERKKKFIKYGAIGVAAVVCIAVLISFMRSSVNRKDLVFSEVDNGTIEVSVSASGKVVPAFEEIINSPINTRIVEVYRKGGDSVDVGTPILKLDLQSTETEYKKLLDEEQMKRILKFSSEEADHYIRSLNEEIAVVKHNIEHIIPYSIAYYERIKAKYGKGRERKTEIRNFENIEAAKVVIANEKLYINREEGFIGTALKKDEFICECSDMDDVIVFKKDGTYYVTKVADKIFVGKDVHYGV